MTQTEALKMALEALGKVTKQMLALKDELAERGARPTTDVYHQKLWDSAFEAYTEHALPAAAAIKEALAQPEPKYTTTRNAWTGTATHKCNQCGREDFRSEHAAKFHKCEAVEEPEPHSQDRWLDIQLPDTTPPQRKPLTDEEIMNIAKVSCIGISPHEDTLNFAKVIEAAHGIKEQK